MENEENLAVDFIKRFHEESMWYKIKFVCICIASIICGIILLPYYHIKSFVEREKHREYERQLKEDKNGK